MKGPFPKGTFDSSGPVSEWSWEKDQLVRGQQYRIIKSFADAHGDWHIAGEQWIFLRSMFNKFDNEFILCVQSGDGNEWTISLLWRPGQQIDVIENLSDYVQPPAGTL
jgi:hypothetical protein